MSAKRNAPPVTLPPKTAARCWVEFLYWSLGVPAVVVGGLAIIMGALWLTGGQEMAWQAVSGMGTALFWIGAIALMYPAMLVVWVLELQGGLRAAQDWAAMSAEEQAAALAAVPAKRKRG
jgi:hypothetical protein